MRPKSPPNYLAGYPESLVEHATQMIAQDRLSALLRRKYPLAHDVRTDKALYDYVQNLKGEYLRNAGQLSKVEFDSKLHVIKNALGTHTTVSRVQGANLRTKRNIQGNAMRVLAHDCGTRTGSHEGARARQGVLPAMQAYGTGICAAGI